MNEFYIYIYLDNRKPGRYCYEDVCFLFEPFYVGKGKERRIKKITDRREDFIDIINEIKKLELEPVVIKLYENLSEEKSFELETKMINKIGRLDLGTGTLINRTSGGQGRSGSIVSEEIKEKLRKNYQEVKNEFERRNYFLLTKENEYKNNKQKLKYICPEGHEGCISWGNFQREKGCSICYNKLRSENNIGENSPYHKLTEQQVIQIKLLLEEGKLTQQEIADIFGVCQQTISDIKYKRSWRWIKI